MQDFRAIKHYHHILGSLNNLLLVQKQLPCTLRTDLKIGVERRGLLLCSGVEGLSNLRIGPERDLGL